MKKEDKYFIIAIGTSCVGVAIFLCLFHYFRNGFRLFGFAQNESESLDKRPSRDNFVAEFDEEVPKIDNSNEGRNLPPPNYEIATEQFKVRR